MEERGLTTADVRSALENGDDIESRPDESHTQPGWSWASAGSGPIHVAVRDNIEDDEIIVETAYVPSPELWEPGFRTRRRKAK